MQMRYIRCFVVPGTMIFADFFFYTKKIRKKKEETDQEKNRVFFKKQIKKSALFGNKKNLIFQLSDPFKAFFYDSLTVVFYDSLTVE